MTLGAWEDGSVVEAASWRLASGLCRRHSARARLFRGHPGGGMYDVLWIIGSGAANHLDIRLNRVGTIQVHGRCDGCPPAWRATSWDEYLRSEPRMFLHRLEAAARLPPPAIVPAAAATTLTLRVLAALAATAAKSVATVEIAEGMIGPSGDGGGRFEEAFARFPIGAELRRPLEDDLFGAGEYRCWFVRRAGNVVLAFEQTQGWCWPLGASSPVKVMEIYEGCRRDVVIAAGELLRRVAARPD